MRCPVCQGQGTVCKAALGQDTVYVCDECDALWPDAQAITRETAVSIELFLRARGIAGGRATLGPLDMHWQGGTEHDAALTMLASTFDAIAGFQAELKTTGSITMTSALEALARIAGTEVSEKVFAQVAAAAPHALERQQYLGHVTMKLWELARGDQARFTRFTLSYRKIEPYGVLGLVITGLGLPGSARVLAVSVSVRGEKTYRKFPKSGVMHYELIIGTASTTQWISTPDRAILSTDAVAIAAALYEWADAAPLPPRAAVPAAPISARDLDPLRAHAAAAHVDPHDAPALRQAAGVTIDFDVARPPIGLSGASLAALAADLEHLDPLALMRNVPHDDRGRLDLGAIVLLARYEFDTPRDRNANMPWLAARLPEKRGGDQVVTITLVEHTGKTNPHRWDLAPWLWDRRAARASEGERWGVDALPVERLGLEHHEAEVTALETKLARGGLSEAERAAYCIVLQDAGRLLEALTLFDVELSDEIRTLLDGGTLPNLSEKQARAWPGALHALLRASAPWRFRAALEGELAARVARGVKKPKPVRLRLNALPHQPYVAKYAVILVGAGADGVSPRLEGEYTGWDARLADTLWRRPLELDLLRFGLEKSAAD